MLSVSVATCAFTEERWEDLNAAIASVREQTHRPQEILVVIDNNAALLGRARSAFPDVVVLANDHARGASGARNTAAIAAKSDILAFLDDDARADPSWLEFLLQPFQDSLVAGVGGRAVPDWPRQRPGWFPPEFDWVVGCSYVGMPDRPGVVRNPIGTNMSVRRELMNAVGGFREGFGNVVIHDPTRKPKSRLSTCEETEFCIRLVQSYPGMHWYYQPSATVHHRVPVRRTTVGYFLDRCWLEGQGKALLADLVGHGDALSSERTYVSRTIPHGIQSGIADGISHPRSGGLGRATMLAAGLGVVATSYSLHRISSGALGKRANPPAPPSA